MRPTSGVKAGRPVIIINADDWGRSRSETDAAAACYRVGGITSVTAMMFMADSSRAADLAKQTDIGVGLHLNLSQPFTGETRLKSLREHHDQVVHHLTRSKYSVLVYNPLLRQHFRYVYEAQIEEFVRLYGKPPTHIDGHHHKHLCTNMLLDRIIPAGERVRRSFSYWPGEKNLVNRAYRHLVDRSLARRYRITDFFFSLSECLRQGRLERVIDLAATATVELMVHPINAPERAYLMSDRHLTTLSRLQTGTHRSI